MKDTKLNLAKLIERRNTTLQNWLSEKGISTYDEFLARLKADNMSAPEHVAEQVKRLFKPVEPEPAPVNMEPEQPKKTKKRG